MKYLLFGFIGIVLLVMCLAKPNKNDSPASTPTKNPASEYLDSKQQQLEQAQQAVAQQQAQLNAQQDALKQLGAPGAAENKSASPSATSTAAHATSAKPANASQQPFSPGKDWAQLCHNSSLLGERIMHTHQAGGSQAELLKLAQTADADTATILQSLLPQVQQATRYPDPALQQDMINSFKNTVYTHCMQHHA